MDPAGLEDAGTLENSFYASLSCVCVVFDVKSKNSYSSIAKWIKESKRHNSEVPVIVVCSKIDLDSNSVNRNYSVARNLNCETVFVAG